MLSIIREYGRLSVRSILLRNVINFIRSLANNGAFLKNADNTCVK